MTNLFLTVLFPVAFSFEIIGYYANWGVYARKFLPSAIPQSLTQINYAFLDVAADGVIIIRDVDRTKDGDNSILAAVGRSGKGVLSIGGWTYSANFQALSSDPNARVNFAQNAKKLVEEYGFKGVDIDWENHQFNEADGNNYVELLKELRSALGNKVISIAVAANSELIRRFPFAKMNEVVDQYLLMAYDYNLPSGDKTGHLANFYGQVSTRVALDALKQQGAQTNKIVLGLPLYGYAYKVSPGLSSPLNQPFQRVQGSFGEPSGAIDYTEIEDKLKEPENKVTTDDEAVASWLYHNKTGMFISFDTKEVLQKKTELARNEGLGGVFFWDVTKDKNAVGISAITGNTTSQQNITQPTKTQDEQVETATITITLTPLPTAKTKVISK